MDRLTFSTDTEYEQAYSRLRSAQGDLRAGQIDAALRRYREVLDDPSTPELFREEARRMVADRDGDVANRPIAGRVEIPQIIPAVEFFVSPEGDDAAPGTSERPFASLERARDAARTAQAAKPGAVVVTLKPGRYHRSTVFSLGRKDGGAADAPVVYRAEASGTAILYGGAELAGFELVEDPAVLARLPEEARGKVYSTDLKAQGITDYGTISVRGFAQPTPRETVEVFFNGKPLTLARWPNESFVEAGTLIDPGEPGKTPSVFEYRSDRHERWMEAEDAWIFGYFRWLWADATAKIGSIDPATKQLSTEKAYDYRGTGMSDQQGIIYYAFNLLEELDMPGEWYLDRSSGTLYLWPPDDPAEATVELGMLSTEMVSVAYSQHIRFEGIAFDLGRSNGIRITNSDHCLVAGCTVTRFAGNGISIDGGEACGIFGSDVSVIGRRATEVMGGDRTSLTPARHFVENCRIHDFGRIDRTYTPAVQLEGVGNRVAHNLFYDAPSSVMRIEGNDHVIEYNETHSAVQESDDQGAMELFYNPTYRGVVFRYNLFHNNGKTGAEAAVHGQAAIRLDDAISGVLIHGNIFVRSANGNFGAVQINSGRDNVIENNLIVDCKQGVSGGYNPNNHVWVTLREGNPRSDIYHESALYLERYPLIGTMMDEPGMNAVRRNILYRSGPLLTRGPERFDLFANVEIDEATPLFADEAAGNYAIRDDATVFEEVWFAPIPVGEIGVYEHRLRASWPIKTTPVALPDWRK